MGRLNRFIDDCKLYLRFACRRMGVPGYQIHQICLPEEKLIYIPIPKNACTSIKHALYEIEFGKRYRDDDPELQNYREHHDYYNKRSNAFTGIDALREKTDFVRFAIIRDPVKRLISCYRNRVVDLEDLESSRIILEHDGLPIKPDLNAFVLNLAEYRNANKSIEHHSRPQSHFLGRSIDYLDRLYRLEEMDELIETLREYKADLELLNRKTGGTEITLQDLSPDALEKAIRFYWQDYELLSDFYSPDQIREAYAESIS